jgi:cytidylate kinase
VSPLIAAEDAVTIDSTELSVDAVFNRVLDLVATRGLETRASG